MTTPIPQPLTDALARRRSVRGYHAEPLSSADIHSLFEAAQSAPSWCNVQPWRVVVTAPPVTQTVRQALLDVAKSELPGSDLPFPNDYPQPYAQHRRDCGVSLYGAMGVERGDGPGRHAAWLRNYELFDAPHLAVVSQDRRLGQYATLDVGVWLGILLTVAASMGIDTCAMASVAAYPKPLRKLLDIPEEEIIVFGLVLGREDTAVAANTTRTTRAPARENVRFVGFSETGQS